MAETTTLDRLTREDRTRLTPRSDEDILDQARARFRQAQDFEQAEREQQYKALLFRSGKHYPDAELAQRSQPGSEQPSLVIPRQEAYINQVLNQYRKNPLGIRVRAKSGGATKQVADVLEGKCREIEQESRADQAYAAGFSCAVGQGEGFFRLVTEYEEEMSFQQCIKVCPIYSRFSVYCDPVSVDPAGLDLEWAFVTTKLSHDTFCQKYEVAPADVATWAGYGDTEWVSRDDVMVADYYYKTYKTVTIFQMPDGRVLEAADGVEPEEGWPTRTTRRQTIHWVQLCGYAVLEKTVWPGKYIPLIRVEGQRLDFDGRTHRTGMTQAGADSAYAYDVYASAEMSAIALAPKAPYILYAVQIAGYEGYWNQANDGHMPYLPIKAVVEGGQLLPPPRREVAEPAIQAISAARMGAAADLQASLGMFDPTKLNPATEQSGVALENRQTQGEQSNYSYSANLAWSIRACGLQIIDLLPKLYSGPTTLRQISQDGQVQMTPVNRPAQDGYGRQVPPEERLMLAQGQYDVAISSGPALETQRMEVADKLGTLAAAVPDAAPYFLDMYAANLDFPGSQDLAARLKTLVPPAALSATEGGNPEQKVAQLQNQLQQATQQLQGLTQQMEQMQQQTQLSTQQLALTEQENARLKTQMADKRQENAISTQKAAWDHEEAVQANRLKAAELSLKYGDALAQQALEQERVQIEREKVQLANVRHVPNGTSEEG